MIAALLLEMAASLALTMPAELAEDWTALAWLLSPEIVLVRTLNFAFPKGNGIWDTDVIVFSPIFIPKHRQN